MGALGIGAGSLLQTLSPWLVSPSLVALRATYGGFPCTDDFSVDFFPVFYTLQPTVLQLPLNVTSPEHSSSPSPSNPCFHQPWHLSPWQFFLLGPQTENMKANMATYFLSYPSSHPSESPVSFTSNDPQNLANSQLLRFYLLRPTSENPSPEDCNVHPPGSWAPHASHQSMFNSFKEIMSHPSLECVTSESPLVMSLSLRPKATGSQSPRMSAYTHTALLPWPHFPWC